MKYLSSFGVACWLFVLLCQTSTTVYAQAPAWQAAIASNQANGNTSAVAAMATDGYGGLYLAGHFTGTVSFGTLTLTSAGSSDVFVAKWNGYSFDWAERAGGSAADQAAALAVQGGYVYVAGSFESAPASFGARNLNTAGGADGFLAKFTDLGSSADCAWAQRMGGSGNDYVQGIVTTSTFSYITGYFYSPAFEIGGYTNLGNTDPSGSTSDVFAAKIHDYGPSTTMMWATSAGGPDTDQANAIAVNGTTIYIGGSFSGATATFGATTLTNASAGSLPMADAFVAKLSTSPYYASFDWAQQAGGTGADWVNALAVQGTGVFAAGSFGSTAASFGSTTLSNAGSGGDVFVAQLNDAGATSGYAWAQRAGGPGHDNATALALNGGSAYISGTFEGNAVPFGASALTASGAADVFVAKLTITGAAGNFVWAQQGGGSAGDAANTITVSPNGVVRIAGAVQPPASFGSQSIASPAGSSSAFIATLHDLAPVLSGLNPGSGSVGNTIALSGANLVGASLIAFSGASSNTVASGFTISPDGTRISGIIIPAGAGSGPISVITPAGVATSVGRFTLVPLSVRAHTPAANANYVPRNTGVGISFNVPPAVASASAIRVTGNRYKGQRSLGAASLSGSTLTVPVTGGDFLPGESVTVTVPAGVQTSGGAAALPHVFQFVTASSGGSGMYVAPLHPDPEVGSSSFGLAVGDLDGNGTLDLVASDNGGGGIHVRLNNGSGLFTPPAVNPDPPYGGGLSHLVLGDLDGNGTLDLVASGGGIQVLLNRNGDGNFVPPAANGNIGEYAFDIALGDLNGDGYLDLAGAGGFSVKIRLNDGQGNLVVQPNTPTVPVLGTFAESIALGDIDGDGDLDFVTADSQGATVSVRLNDGAGNFSTPPVNADFSLTNNGQQFPGPRPQDIALADLDGDGDLDFVTADGYSGGTSTGYNDGTGNFSVGSGGGFGPAQSLVVEGGYVITDPGMSLALGDVDNDGDLDKLSLGSFSATNVIGIQLNQSAGPSLSSASPASGPVGSTITLNGNNLLGTAFITFTGSSDNVVTSGFTINAAGTQITGIVVPIGAVSGPVTVSSSGGLSNGLNFTVSTPTVSLTWTGAVSTAWTTAGNWSPAVVPSASASIVIPSLLNQPLLTDTVACAALIVESGASMTIAASGHLTVNGHLQVQGPSSAAAGRFLISGGTLALAGNAVIDGQFSATGGHIMLTGAVAQEVSGNGVGISFWNLNVGPAGVRLLCPVVMQRVLTLHGNLNTNGAGLILSSDSSGTAMVVNAGGVVLGLAGMQRHIGGPNAGLGYRHYSSPMQTTPAVSHLAAAGFMPVVNPAYNTVGNTVSPFPNVFSFNEARIGGAGTPGPLGFEQGWQSPASTAEQLLPGRGYTVNIGAVNKVTLFGTFNNGSVPVTGGLSSSGSGPFAGYHLLGNPYPSPIIWDSIAKPAGLDNAVYVFRSSRQYTGFYDSYVNGIGTLAGGEIAAMQGFFVHVSQAVPAFAFQNAARKTTYASPVFQRSTTDTRPKLALAMRAAGGNATDVAYVYFENRAILDFDASYDARKLPNPGGLNLAFLSGAKDYAIKGLPLLGAQPLVLPLQVTGPTAGRYELSADVLRNFAPGTTLWLRDALLNTLTPLAEGSRYGFTLSGAAAPGRFSLEFRPGGVMASSANVLAAQVRVFPNPAHGTCTLVLLPLKTAAQAVLYNSLGQKVLALPIAAGQSKVSISVGELAAGVYSLRVPLAEGRMVAQRLVVR